MNQPKISLAVALLLIALFLAGCDASTQSVASSSQQAVTNSNSGVSSSDASGVPSVSWPVLHNIVATDSSAAKQVEDAIKFADKVSNYTALTFDLSMLPNAYTNDPAVPPTAEQAKFISDVAAAQGGSVAADLSNRGWLSYMKAYYLNWKRGAEGWERIRAKASAEGRHVTSADIASITGTVGSPVVGNNVSGTVNFADAPTNAMYDFKEVKIEGGWADVTYDDGLALNRVFLVKTAEGWKEAGLISLKIHF